MVEICPTKRALDAGDSAAFSSIFLASSFSCSQAESPSAPAPVTRAVGQLSAEKPSGVKTIMMSINDFAQLAGAIQSLVVAIAVVVGGGWALFQFISLNSVAKAKAELESLRRSLGKRSIIELNIEHEIFPHPIIDTGKCVLCTVHLNNIGNHLELLDLSTMTLVAKPLLFGVGETIPTLSNNKLVALYYYDSTKPVVSIDTGEKIDFRFVLLLPQTGIYILNFDITRPSIPQDETFSELKSVIPHLDPTVGHLGAQTTIYVQ